MLVSKFEFFANRINIYDLETIEKCVLAGVALHNWLISDRLKVQPRSIYVIKGSHVEEISNATEDPREMREQLKEYFNNIGMRYWQWSSVLNNKRKNL